MTIQLNEVLSSDIYLQNSYKREKLNIDFVILGFFI